MKLPCALLLVGCSASHSPSPAPSAPAAPLTSPVTPPLANHVAAAPPAAIEPLLVEPANGRSCELRWDELDANAPATIPLLAAGSQLDEECADADGFNPAASACAADADCIHAVMRGQQKATLSVSGPDGSGHFASLAFSVDGKRFACMMASTVGWRYLSPVGEKLAPLPWLADVDGDGDAELVLWSRLPWGDSEVANALMPVVYILDGDRLVRRDDKAKALRVKVADAYHELVRLNESPDARACFVAVTAALGG